MKKEKNELQKLLSLETQKTMKLKKFAEEEQKKHIKYKNKLEKYKQRAKTEEKKLEEEKNKKPKIDFFIYSNSPAFDDNKNMSRLKEDIFKLKQLLDEEKNKNVILQLLSDNEKEKNELMKNKYNKTKKLNENLMNKIKEEEFTINKEIKLENEALRKQLIETESKNDELRQKIQKLNDEINSYKNNEKNMIMQNDENNRNIENNIRINPINTIKDDKFKSEKKNFAGIFKNSLIEDKKNQRFSIQISKPTFHGDLGKKPSEKNLIPKSNKDVIKPKFDKDKVLLLQEKKKKSLIKKNQKNANSNSITTKKLPNNLKLLIPNQHNDSDIKLILNKSDSKENPDLEIDNKIKIQRSKKRESSEKVLRIFNGNNMSSSEFSSEKNLSENNKASQIGISNVIKEYDNEDEEEKFNSDVGENKIKDNENNNNNEIDNNIDE